MNLFAGEKGCRKFSKFLGDNSNFVKSKESFCLTDFLKNSMEMFGKINKEAL